MDSYEDKIEVLVNFSKQYFEKQLQKVGIFINSISIDGGECTGTTTITAKLTHQFNERGFSCINNREPSLETKKNFVSKMEENGDLITPTDKSHFITDIFMSDRKEGQQNMEKGSIYITDRGIMSTIVYQSGILDDNTTVGDIIQKCTYIAALTDSMEIKLPKRIIIVGSFDNQISESDSRNEFLRRLNNKIKSGEANAMDNIDKCIKINKVYSDLGSGLYKIKTKTHQPYFHCIEFHDDLNKMIRLLENILMFHNDIM